MHITLIISLHLDENRCMNHGDIFVISCRMFQILAIVNALFLENQVVTLNVIAKSVFLCILYALPEIWIMIGILDLFYNLTKSVISFAISQLNVDILKKLSCFLHNFMFLQILIMLLE